MLDHLDGKAVEPEIDTGAAVVTPENMNTPQMQRLLYPVPKAATQGS
jgi:ribose transport system substrate-binding protein